MAQNPLVKTSPTLQIAQIQDQVLRQNFQALADYFAAQNQLLGFQFMEVTFDKAVTGRLLSHSVGVIPQDIVVTRLTGAGKVTFNYSAFSSNQISLTSTDACRIRFFVGTYWDQVSSVNNSSTDAATYVFKG